MSSAGDGLSSSAHTAPAAMYTGRERVGEWSGPLVTCSGCVYWQTRGDISAGGGWGFCRRRSPAPGRPHDERGPVAEWPLTAADDGCGEGWERAEIEANEEEAARLERRAGVTGRPARGRP